MSSAHFSDGTDLADLVVQLRKDGIAFGADNPVNPALEADLLEALTDVGASGGSAADEVNIVVLEHTPQHVPQLRDLAQDLQIETGAETVLIRTPHAAVGVSDDLTRAQIEQGQRAMASQPDYADGVLAFFAEADGLSVPWMGVAAAVFLVVVLVVTATVIAARSSATTDTV